MNPLISTLHRAAGSTTTRRPLRHASQLLSLEQRFMFDGAVADAAHAAQAHDTPPPPVPPAVTVRAADPTKDEGKKEVVLVDTSVDNYKSLEAGVRDGIGIVEFDGSKDGLAQIAQWAATQNGLDAIHILSHGSEGVVNLGTSVLTESSLASATTQAELAQLGQALTADGDLLLYGCDVAAGSDGAVLIDSIARATGADVAASTDLTGAARLGGNWTLETHDGTIDTRALALTDYDGALVATNITGVNASTADGAYGSGATITITVDFSGAVDVDTSGGTPMLALDGGGNATYTGGSGSSTLTFSYTVGAGQNSADLDVSSTSALSLNGATIVDSGGAHLNAALTLAAPGTAGSLGASKDIVIDTAAPSNTVAGAAFSADTGTFNNDFITSTAAQTISGTLASNLAAGEHIYVSLDNGGSWILATASVGANTWSLAGQTLSGSGTLKVRVSDDAGNNGADFTQAYVLDTTAPTTSFSNIALSADHGASNSDLITNAAAQTISATLSSAPAGSDRVFGSLDNGFTWTDITSRVSGTTLTWTGVTLAASNTLLLRVTDAAGNDGVIASRAYVLDTTAPTTAVSTVSFSADSGSSSSDFITNTAAQIVSGTLSANLAAGETVMVSLDNGATWIAAAATVGTNTWSLAGRTLSASDTLQVKVSDIAGNDGAVLSQAYVYDTAATVPTVDTLQTTSSTPTLTGNATLAAGETMTVTVGGATYDVVPVAGSWSLDLATAVPASGALALAAGNRYQVVATVTDLAGNTSNDASTNELTVGTIAGPIVASQLPPQLPVQTQTPEPLVLQPSSDTSTPTDVPTLVPIILGVPTQSGAWTSELTPSVSAIDSTALLDAARPIEVRSTPSDGNAALVANVPIADLNFAGGDRISYEVPQDTFTFGGEITDLTLSATQADGRPLPSWLKFDARTGRLEGTAPAGFVGTLTFKLTARDAQGHVAVQTFKIVVTKDGQRSQGAQLERNTTEPVGRTGLSEQIKSARTAGADRLAMLAHDRAAVRLRA